MGKVCKFCNKFLDFSFFTMRKDKENFDTTDGRKYMTNCMCCTSLVTKLNYYNISEEDFNNLRLEYRDCCGICGKHESECRNLKTKHYGLYIDHCHETNIVRGLLCHNCNLIIGHAKDDLELLKSAILYLDIVR